MREMVGREFSPVPFVESSRIRCLPMATGRVSNRTMRQSTRSIEIIGGGLAGLVAGVLMRRRGLPVVLREAGQYPRHRVCGEFLCGLGDDWVSRHGLDPEFAGAARNRSCAWFLDATHPFHTTELPATVLGISRFRLDQRLADAFVADGGNLMTGTRADPTPAEGKILACGRPAGGPPKWVGLKAHLRNEPLAADLEVHLGRGGYIGLARIEAGLVNVCGLFPASAAKAVRRGEPKLAGAAEAIGLPELARRLRAADWMDGAAAGCAAASLGWQSRARDPSALAIGDAVAMIPPFTGNGMTMAMQAGAAIVPHAEQWSRGKVSWPEAVARARRDLRSTFTGRMRWAGLGHPVLLKQTGQRAVAWLARHRLLPFEFFFRLTH